MSEAKAQQEPTMEEILASIRRIISEDGSPAPEAAKPAPVEAEPPPRRPGVLDLTQEVKDDGSVVPVAPPPPPPVVVASAPPPPPPPVPEPPPVIMRPPTADTVELDDGSLVSDPVAKAAAAQFGNLANRVTATRSMPLGDTNRTLEDLVKELLRPMLRDWLDANLAPIVQRLVEREVAKLALRADQDRN
jgi:cell pole-organizing protein PopZ